MKPAHTIVVGRGYNALNIVWALSDMGVPCVVYSDRRIIAGWSRLARYVPAPDASTQEAAFQDGLVALCRSLGDNPVVIPTNDKWALAVARAKARLTGLARPCVADADTVAMLLDKAAFARIGQQRNYRTLPSYDAAAVLSLGDDDFPIIGKPNTRETSSNVAANLATEQTVNADRLTVLHSKSELTAFLATHAATANQFVFQPYVTGDCSHMYTIGVYAGRDGVVYGLFAGRKVRGYPPEYGDCVRGETWQPPDELIALVHRICEEISYHGIAEFEFKRDPQTGRYWLIEINPRSWSWIGITRSTSANLAKIAYEDLALDMRSATNSLTLIDGQLSYGFLSGELVGAMQFRNNPFNARPVTVLRDYISGRVICGDLRWNEPITMLAGLALLCRNLLKGNR